MFELNLAVLPNHILYLEGVQLSYIKVFVQIFNLWNCNKSCYISNAEFAKRTSLHKDTVINAIQFFEKHNILKRVHKGSKRYLIQVPKEIEIEVEPEVALVDNSSKSCTNNARGSELDHGGVGVRPFRGSELDRYNKERNLKNNKTTFNNSSVFVDNPAALKQMAKFWEPGNPDYDRLHSDYHQQTANPSLGLNKIRGEFTHGEKANEIHT